MYEPLYPSQLCGEIIPQLFFYKDRMGTTYPTKINMPPNKETQPNQSMGGEGQRDKQIELGVWK